MGPYRGGMLSSGGALRLFTLPRRNLVLVM
jgi:hypothetical protein